MTEQQAHQALRELNEDFWSHKIDFKDYKVRFEMIVEIRMIEQGKEIKVQLSAPEMIDALKALYDHCDEMHPHHQHICPICAPAKKAIVKIEGKE